MKNFRIGRTAAALFAQSAAAPFSSAAAAAPAAASRRCGSPSGIKCPTAACSIGSSPMATTIYGTNGSNTNGVSHLSSSSIETISILRHEIESLSDEVARRDRLIESLRERIDALEKRGTNGHATAADLAAPVQPRYPPGAHIVSTTTEFEQAIARNFEIIALAPGSHVRPASIAISADRCLTIVGPPGTPAAQRPVLEGHLCVKGHGARLVIRDVEVRGTSTAEPCISVAASGVVELENATVRNGRDGVYLTGKSTASLTKCLVAGNKRGIFEMQRCCATLRDCAFDANLFHCVLLAAPQAVMAAKVSRVQEDAHGRGNVFKGGRADVALTYNPMEDRYGETFRGAKLIKLSAAESTAGLVDEAW